MSRFRKLSHAIWHCQYHFVWVPKYRYGILTGLVGQELERCIILLAPPANATLALNQAPKTRRFLVMI